MTDAEKPGTQVQLPGEREVPQYRRLADLVRGRVADGTYLPGERIPSETAFAKSTGLSFLTVRQALKVLVDEGILERFPGRGTFVTGLNWRRAHFSLNVADPGLAGQEFACELLFTSVERAAEGPAARLGVARGTPLALLRHSFRLPGKAPFMAEEGLVILDPYRPLIEAELSASFLKGIIQGGAQGLLKSAALNAAPARLSESEAALFGRVSGDPALRLDYLFFDASSHPVAAGAYTAPEGVLNLTAELGLPLDACVRRTEPSSPAEAPAGPEPEEGFGADRGDAAPDPPGGGRLDA
ncbi:MAG: GntR family transcriptional regulator [Deltaproteobacteria bacterium]|jgi:GntR family transcriptional regulator|nr:GntR family transcriptional regulator [Deltaproteobacteria bacterium]